MNTLPIYDGKALATARTFEWLDEDGKILLKDQEALDSQSPQKKVPFKKETIAAYIPNEDIIEAVKLTRILKRPLLLKGEPGCGKTRLAKAVAFELYGAKYHNYYFEWNIKSTTKARDGLYTFDHIRRLRDAQVKEHNHTHDEDGKPKLEIIDEVELKKTYREFGPLGEAFQVSTREHPAVILIDEVDKADIDFPNDLLLELDQLRFYIEETKEEIEAAYPPIIFITSNDEKVLPPAFLRRCLFHYIDFPNTDILEMIIEANFPLLEENVVKAAVERFERLRKAMKENLNTEKAASTSELIDWIRVINHYYIDRLIQELDGHLKEDENGKKGTISQQAAIAVYDLLTLKLSEDDEKALKNKISELIEGVNPEAKDFRNKLVGKLKVDEEADGKLADQVNQEFLKHYQTLIKSLTDFKLQVAEAKEEYIQEVNRQKLTN